MGHRWRGYEHPELFTMINAGLGPSASDPQTAYWKSLSDELALVDEELNAKLRLMGASWQGKAAESAQSGLTPLAQWAGDAESGANVMSTSAEYQADYIADARHQMPPPVKVTTPAPSGWDIASAGAAGLLGNPGPALNVAMQAADHEAQESAQNEAELEAVRTMESYEKSSTWNRNTLGTFVAPPDVVISTPPPQGTGGGERVVIGTIDTYQGSDGTGTSPNGHTGTTGTTGAPQPPQVGGNPGGNPGGGGGGGGGGGTTLPPGTNPPGTGNPPGSQLPPGTTPSGSPPPLVNPNPNPLPPVNPPVPPPNPLPPTNNPGFPPNPLPPFTENPNPNPNNTGNKPLLPGPGGRGPLPPVRPGMPGMPGTPGMPGFPGGPGGIGGAMDPDGSRPGSQLGRGGLAGAGLPGENGVVRNGPGAASAAGGRGGVNAPMAPGGRKAEDEDDDERFAPDYLLETDDVFGDDRRVAPTVIGE